MKSWWRNQQLILKVILGILLLVIVGLIAAIIIFSIVNRDTHQPEDADEEPLTQMDIRNAAYEIYSKEGLEKMQEYYDNFGKNVHTVEEKKSFLSNKIVDYDAVCGWECSEQILESVHLLYDLAPGDAVPYNLCYYEKAYADIDPIDACGQPEGYYEG